MTHSAVGWTQALGQRVAAQMLGLRGRVEDFLLDRVGTSTAEYAVIAAIVGSAIFFTLGHLKRH